MAIEKIAAEKSEEMRLATVNLKAEIVRLNTKNNSLKQGLGALFVKVRSFKSELISVKSELSTFQASMPKVISDVTIQVKKSATSAIEKA